MTKRKYLIDELIPATGIHFIAGPSGAGKTTWLFQALKAYLQGEPVLDHAVHPAQVFYVAADRDEDETEETMERVGLDPSSIPFMSLMESTWGIDDVFSHTPKGTKWLIIEGIASLVEGGKLNDYDRVAAFIKYIRKYSKIHDLSVLGTVHMTKTKEGERFENPRQRILGSVAWGAFSGNMIIIEPEKPSKITDKGRILLELPRNGDSKEHRFALDSMGRFVPTTPGAEEAPRLMMLTKLPKAEPFTWSDAVMLAQEFHVSESTVTRWLRQYEAEGHIVKIEGGYIRPTLTMDQIADGVKLPTKVEPETA